MNTTTTTLPRREICNVLRQTRGKANPPEVKFARMALAEIYDATQNRQLTDRENDEARRIIKCLFAAWKKSQQTT